MKSIYKFLTVITGTAISLTGTAQTPCDTIAGVACKSIVSDTVFNPYVTGVLGNWRSKRSYTYYANRAETEPAAATDIRRHGTFGDFATFWSFQDDKLAAQPDTTRWVWNSEMTLFNRKGFEIENKDPLGRYNAGLYGYNLTLPIAVVQNSRYHESGFEGFEDYNFETLACDTGCSSVRHIDYSAFQSQIDTAQKHTGKNSLRVEGGEYVSLGFILSDFGQEDTPTLDFTLLADTCSPDGNVLESIKSDKKILLPAFSPTRGIQMVISAWIKEVNDSTDCNCTAYSNNRIVLSFTGGTPVNLQLNPTGAIIEGWQRFENYFTIPADADTMTVTLEALTDTVTCYFDDIRFHPFNANMKSFVFHPVNLRLMAELDENNYATFYEYDDDGTLIRLKKETQRGIKTIRETRSALVKEVSQ